jgi:CBS domain containing-hemolysin-like protein
MIASIFGFAAILLALFAIALQRFYSCVPAKELRRLAARGDHLAQALYRPVAYGASLRVLLWSVVVVALPAGFALLVSSLPLAVVTFVLALTIAVGFVWLPSLRLSVHSARLAVWIAPALDYALNYTHSFFDTIAGVVNRYRSQDGHTGLYEKEDVAALLEQQREQVDSRLSNHELELIHRTLHFGDKAAADILTSRKKIHLLDAHESLGPILLDELHKSGQTSFLVYQDKPENIVGTTTLKRAASAKQGGKVSDIMSAELCFVNENATLLQVADAFTQTRQQVSAVINNSEELVGIITLDRLLQEAFGELPADEVNYESAPSVANYRPKSQTEEEAADVESTAVSTDAPDEAESGASSPETSEVVE